MKRISMLIAGFYLIPALMAVTAEAGSPLAPTYGFDFAVTGLDGASPVTSVRLHAPSGLRLRITALGADSASGAPYGCAQFEVRVNGAESIVTQVLAVAGSNPSACPGAPTSEVIDLTRWTSATGDASVSISAAGYDGDCRSGTYCAIHAVDAASQLRGIADFEIR